MESYYRVTFDPELEGLWFLDEPLDSQGDTIDARTFTSCKLYGPVAGEFMLPVDVPGKPIPFSFGAFDMPVVTRHLGNRIADLGKGEVELLNARTDDVTDLAILNVLECVQCIDEQRTVGDKWTEESGRPDKIGLYRTVVRLYVDPESARGHQIFRVAGWEIALIVSDSMVSHAGLRDLEGIRLTPVI